jgi:hypothetical protein
MLVIPIPTNNMKNHSALSRWRYRTIGVPMPVIIFLSALIFFSAGILLVGEPEILSHLPVLMSVREKDGTFFAKYHYDSAPILYGGFHAFPAVLWCAAIPTQHVKRFRRNHIVLHRWIGRLLVLISILLALTGVYFSVTDLSMSSDVWHVHTLKWGTDPDTALTYLAWPSFRLWALTIGASLAPAAYMTYRYARKGDIVNHQRWAEITTYMGYTVPMERVMIGINFLIGVVLNYLPSHVRTSLRVPDTLQAKHEAEKASFAFTVWSASTIILTYIVVQSRKKQTTSTAAAKSR